MRGPLKIILIAAGSYLAGVLVLLPRQREFSQLSDQASALRKANAVLEARSMVGHAATSQNSTSLAQFLQQSGRNRQDVMRDALQFVGHLKTAEIPGELDKLKKMPSTGATYLMRQLLLARLTNDDPAAAMAWAKSDDPNWRGDDYPMIMQAWSAKDPAAAIAALKQIGDPGTRTSVESQTFGAISLANPQLAMDLLKQIPPGQQSPNDLSGIFRNWASVDPAAASAAALGLPATQSRMNALAALSSQWVQDARPPRSPLSTRFRLAPRAI
ncbi:MAG TPA: hypothetical protein VK737_03150 [Opitutales bacterium]|jgi:hypothetical protein|nr:hypothetical protein [Opitutales bacterium]